MAVGVLTGLAYLVYLGC